MVYHRTTVNQDAVDNLAITNDCCDEHRTVLDLTWTQGVKVHSDDSLVESTLFVGSMTLDSRAASRHHDKGSVMRS